MMPQCIDAWYFALANDNDAEWWIILQQWFNQQPFIATLGYWYASDALFFASWFLLFPDTLPSM